MGLIVGGATIACAQALVLLPLAWLSDAAPSPMGIALAAAALLCTCVALTALGLAFAWRLRDSASFHAVMNLLFMPLWLLSDAFFPVAGAAEPLATIIRVNPLSWCGGAVRAALRDAAVDWRLGAALGFALGCCAIATIVVSRSRRVAMG
jgi:ABC-2 type transport system permease protein